MALIITPNNPRDYRGLPVAQEGGPVQWKITSTDPSLGESVQVSTTSNAFAPGTPVQLINFAAGSANPQYATFTSLDDKTYEVDERFFFQFQPIGATVLNVAENSGAIINNDVLPSIAINAQKNTLLENTTEPNFKFDLTRTGEDLNVTTDVAVSFRAAGPTPADQDDFVTSLDTQIVRFAPGETTKSISLTIRNDDVIEPTESLSANIFSATSTSPTMSWPTTQYNPITKGSVTVSILNDDPNQPGVVVVNPSKLPPTDVYRFYNVDTNTHFFTVSPLERDIIRNTMPSLHYEGVGFTAVPEQPGSDPIFRFYNTQTNTHFFTPSVQERDSIIANFKVFSYEGVGFHASTQDAAGLTEVYRFYNSQTNTHFYTPSILERDIIQATIPQYHLEGVGFWVPDSPDYLLS